MHERSRFGSLCPPLDPRHGGSSQVPPSPAFVDYLLAAKNLSPVMIWAREGRWCWPVANLHRGRLWLQQRESDATERVHRGAWRGGSWISPVWSIILAGCAFAGAAIGSQGMGLSPYTLPIALTLTVIVAVAAWAVLREFGPARRRSGRRRWANAQNLPPALQKR
jgi:hypothetical protein